MSGVPPLNMPEGTLDPTPSSTPTMGTSSPSSGNVDLLVGLFARSLVATAGGNYGIGSMYFPSDYGLGYHSFNWTFSVSGQQFRLKATAVLRSYTHDTGRKDIVGVFKNTIYSEMRIEASATLAFARSTGAPVGVVEGPSIEGVYREYTAGGMTPAKELVRTPLPATATSTRWGNPRFGKTMWEVTGSKFRLFQGNWMTFTKVSGP